MKFVPLVLAAVMMVCTSSCGSSEEHAPPPIAEAPAHGVKDPVCGMIVDPKAAAAKAEYKGKTYYFCSMEDRDRFEKAPSQYVTDGRSPH